MSSEQLIGMTFYRNWYEQAKVMSAKDRALFLSTIFRLAFENGEGVGNSAAELMAVNLCGPSIEKSKSRRLAGRKGGKQNGSKAEANEKQNGSKIEANAKQREREREGEGEYTPISPEGNAADGNPPSFDQVKAWATPAHGFPADLPEEFLREWYDQMQQAGWRDYKGGKLTQMSQLWRRELSFALKRARKTSQSLRKNEEEVSKKNIAPRAIPVYSIADDESVPEWARGLEAAQ